MDGLTVILPAIFVLFLVTAAVTRTKAKLNRKSACILLCSILAVECFYNTIDQLFRQHQDIVYSTRASYVDVIQPTRQVVNGIKAKDDGFYRIEKTYFRTVNDPLACNMYGLSHSSSTLNSKPIELLERLGFSARSHYTRYSGAAEITKSLFGVKYELSSETNSTADIKSEKVLEGDVAFMSYDYNQTQTRFNETYLNKDGQTGEKYMAAMVPVARWNDGTGEKFMRFTESWRSVKTDGWVISKAGVGDDEDKLNACLALIDYAFSPKGQILMSYGPDEFIKTKADGSYETFNFNGEEWPVIADATYKELWDKAGGSYTDYARKYLGSTLSFVKSQSFEYQCTHEVGKEGAGYISKAIALGTIKHPELALASNPWYTSVPTVLPLTDVENNEISTFTNLGKKGKFSSEKGSENLFCSIIVGGFSGEGTTSAEETINSFKTTWKGDVYLDYSQTAWEELVEYYNKIKG